MKKFIILLIFTLGIFLYGGGSDLFPFGMNHTVFEQFYSFTEDIEYKEKYKGSMDWTAAAGIKWWRPQYVFTWYSVQPDKENPNCWDFETEDSIVKWCGERGLNLLPSIGYTADFAIHLDTDPLGLENSRRYPPNPDYWDEYQDYVKAIVERYDGDGKGDTIRGQYIEEPEWLKIPIKYWECMNEPYGEYFLGTLGQYVGMYDSTWKALKSADPDAKILGPCMTSDTGTFEWKYFDPEDKVIKIWEYSDWKDPLHCLINSIGPEKIDVVSHHIYNNTANFMKYTRELDSILKANTGGEGKPIWITETGFNRTDLYKGERGTNNSCTLSSCVTYSSNSGEIFWDYVLVRRGGYDPCTTMTDTFLNIGDTVVLHNRKYNANDTMLYNGGPLIYKGEDTALAIEDTLRILDIWAEDAWHTEFRQDSLYSEFLDSVIKTPAFLENLKIFFYDVCNSMNRYAYPPRIEFEMYPDDTSYRTTRYYRQYLPSIYSVIDTNNDPFDAYYSIRDSILEPSVQTLSNTTINIDETKTYQAKNSITTNTFTIKGNGSNGGKVAMEAGDIIHIQDGFRVEEGGYFYGATNSRYGEVGMGLSSLKGTTVPKAVKIPEENTNDSIPKVFSCAQNYPNPFATSTTIKYGLPRDSKVNLCIFNLLGQKVKTLVDAQQSAGYKSVTWDGRTSTGKEAPKGVYFYTFEAGDFKRHRKMILVK